MSKFIKVRNEIINLDNVSEIAFFTEGSIPYLCFHGDSVIDDSTIMTRFDGDDALIIWDWLNEHVEMSVCPMPQKEATK